MERCRRSSCWPRTTLPPSSPRCWLPARRATTAMAGMPPPWPPWTCPVLQAVAATSSSDAWADSSGGLSPLDVAMAVAVPELDGRVVGPAFSFKETVDDGDDLGAPVTAYRTVADRVDRIAGLASRLASLRRTPVSERRVALVLSAYPTKRSRLGNAVGLDTPASVIELLRALASAGYRVDRVPPDGDALMAELADAVPYASDEPEPVARGDGAGSWSEDEYERHFAQLPAQARADLTEAWGPPPGRVFTDGGHLVFAGLDLGGVLVAVQPPRGFGENAVAVYHSPDLAPTHHYVAFYRWLDAEWGADAIVHVGKHGTLEWLPGKSVGLSAGLLARRRARRPPPRLPLRDERPRRGDPGQAAGPRRDRGPPGAAADAGRHLRRSGPPGDAAGHARPGGRPGPGQASGHPASGMGPAGPGRDPPRPRDVRATRRRRRVRGPSVRRRHPPRRRLPVRAEGRPDPGRAAHPRAAPRRRGRARPGAGPHPAATRALSRRCGRPWRGSSGSTWRRAGGRRSTASKPSADGGSARSRRAGGS